MNQAKCTNCGASLSVQQGDKTCVCQYCQTTNIVENALALGKVEVDVTKDIQTLRSNLATFAQQNSIDEILRVSQKLLDWIPQDFVARYFFAYAKQQQNQPRFMYEFYRQVINHTETELKLVVEHLILFSELRDMRRVLDFLERISPLSLEKYRISHLHRVEKEEQYTNVPRDVFICFSSYNLDIAEAIVREIEADGNTCWISTRNLRPDDSDNYWLNIENAIQNSNVFLVVSSSDAMLSKDVQQEIQLALKHLRRLVEFKIDNSSHNTLFKHAFNGVKWIKGNTNPRQSYASILQRIYDEKYLIKATENSYIDNSKYIKPRENSIQKSIVKLTKILISVKETFIDDIKSFLKIWKKILHNLNKIYFNFKQKIISTLINFKDLLIKIIKKIFKSIISLRPAYFISVIGLLVLLTILINIVQSGQTITFRNLSESLTIVLDENLPSSTFSGLLIESESQNSPLEYIGEYLVLYANDNQSIHIDKLLLHLEYQYDIVLNVDEIIIEGIGERMTPGIHEITVRELISQSIIINSFNIPIYVVRNHIVIEAIDVLGSKFPQILDVIVLNNGDILVLGRGDGESLSYAMKLALVNIETQSILWVNTLEDPHEETESVSISKILQWSDDSLVVVYDGIVRQWNEERNTNDLNRYVTLKKYDLDGNFLPSSSAIYGNQCTLDYYNQPDSNCGDSSGRTPYVQIFDRGIILNFMTHITILDKDFLPVLKYELYDKEPGSGFIGGGGRHQSNPPGFVYLGQKIHPSDYITQYWLDSEDLTLEKRVINASRSKNFNSPIKYSSYGIVQIISSLNPQPGFASIQTLVKIDEDNIDDIINLTDEILSLASLNGIDLNRKFLHINNYYYDEAAGHFVFFLDTTYTGPIGSYSQFIFSSAFEAIGIIEFPVDLHGDFVSKYYADGTVLTYDYSKIIIQNFN